MKEILIPVVVYEDEKMEKIQFSGRFIETCFGFEDVENDVCPSTYYVIEDDKGERFTVKPSLVRRKK